MKTLYFGDLENENDLKDLLMDFFDSYHQYNEEGAPEDIKAMVDETLSTYEFVIANLNNHSYDSDCFFLLRDKSGDYFSVYAGHCSCYAYEGQFLPTPYNLDYAKDNLKYDLSTEDYATVMEFLEKLEETK